jgi:hypothetical protein
MDLLSSEAPALPLFAVGVSLGATVLGLLLAQRGDTTPLRGAALVATPFDLAIGARAVDESPFAIYQRLFLRTLIPKALGKERQFPGCFDPDRVRKIRTMVEYDNIVTAPLHGFRDANDYYTRCSTAPVLADIRVPTLLLSAADDPLVPAHCFPHETARQSPWLTPLLTKHGGHLGFIAHDWKPWHPGVVAGFFRAKLAE